jgi:hypothetical protein
MRRRSTDVGPRGFRVCLAALALVAVVLAAGCGGGDEAAPEPPSGGGETTAPPPATEPAPATTGEAPGTVSLKVYFLRGEELGVVRREVPETKAVAAAAMRELLAGPTGDERSSGLNTAIPEGTTLNGVELEDGTATVDLSTEFDSGGGSLSMFARLGQVVYTLTQFPTVEAVDFELDGEPVGTFSSEGILIEEPQTRADYEDVTPAILVETPAPGDTVASPLRVVGTANVFEATFQATIVDWDGVIIAEETVTASCGTGCRGEFDVSIPFEWTGEPRGALIVSELSAEDGSPINTVEIPLRFR